MNGAGEIRSGVIRPVEVAKEAYELIKSEYWLLFAIWLVGGLIGSVTLMIGAGAMTAGTFYAYLKKIDGQPVAFDDLWKGMQWFLPSLFLMLLIAAPIMVIYGLVYIPILLAAMMGPRLNETELVQMLAGVFIVDAVLLVITVCFHTLIIFAFPLMIDRRLGVLAAIGTSARAVFKNLGGVAGMMGVNFLLILAGYAALCIGVYFVIPIIIASTLVAYRRIFPAYGSAGRFDPPPPSAYDRM